ncbi:MAG: ThuA domain-containing protein [Planctomycetes bacterium]|nr:ThuA domain-containing protein [Planctomycetota bacterium]
MSISRTSCIDRVRPSLPAALTRVLALALLLALGGIASAADAYKVLVFSKTAGFRHGGAIAKGVEAVKKLGAENGFGVDATEDAALFTEANLKNYKVVMWLCTTGTVLDAGQKEAFTRYIQAGGGYVGVHSATDTEYDWPWYGKLSGAYFAGHPAQQKAKVVLVDGNHPSTAGMPASFERFDEWYNFRQLPKDVHVLLKIDETSYDAGPTKMGAEHPLAWYHEYEGGRAFYTEMGHTDESYAEPLYLKHLLGGVQWAAAGPALDFSKARPSDSRFEVTSLGSGSDFPMELSVAADGRVFWCGKFGVISCYKPDTKAVVEVAKLPTYSLRSGEKGNTEDGCIGIVLDPDFMTNHWVYILRAMPGEAAEEHLARFTVSGDTIDLASEKTLLVVKDCRTIVGHCGGCLSFGPGGNLYMSCGDNTTPFESDGFSPMDYREPGKDARGSASNTMDLRGKILRIHPEADGTYTIPKGNLFAPGTDKTRPEIYVMGCRNPFRHAVDSATGYLYWGEVGPDSGKDGERGPKGHDEFNRATAAGYFGWPLFVGDNKAYAAYDFATKKLGDKFDPAHPINDSPVNTGIRELPPAQPAWMWYPYSKSEEFPDLGEGGRCAMSGPVYHFDPTLKNGTQFPAWYDGKLFLYEWMRNWVKTLDTTAADPRQTMVPFMPTFTWMKPMDMRFGPDGSLYVILWGTQWWDTKDSQIIRIDYIAGNRSPVAKAGSDVTAGKEPLAVKFSSAGTYDKDDGDVLKYEWRFTGDAVESSEANPTFTFAKPGLYQAKLTVTDQGGKSAIAVVPITVGNAVPTIALTAPKGGGFFSWGKNLTYRIDVTDAEDGGTADGKISSRVKFSAQYIIGAEPKDLVGFEQSMMGGSVKGRQLILASDCMACHQPAVQSVGPAFTMIAAKYHDEKGIVDKLAQKIITGGAGVWGPIAMAAHPQHSKEVVSEMVGWILSLAETPPELSGASGAFTVVPKPKDDTGIYLLTATYTDRKVKTADGKEIPSNTVRTTVVLRNRLVRASSFSDQHGVQSEDTKDSGGGKSIGFIDNGDWMKFADIGLDGTTKMTFRVASAGSGGTIEVHLDKPEGDLIGSAEVKPTGDWQKWAEVQGTVKDPGGVHDLYLVFKGPGGGLFNLNWMRFEE